MNHPATPRPERFTIAVPPAVLDDLAERLRRTRFAPDFGNADWSYGVEAGYLRDIVRYWADGFDWRAQERAINAYAHYRVTLDGVPIHYMRVPGRGPAPIPLILTHGWPWTFWDFRDVIGPLSDPAAHGGDPADAFELIVPSLPGFGFSTPLTRTGIDFVQVADLWHRLMHEVLGFERYAAHGGDWGALVTTQLAHKYAAHLHGIQLSAPMKLDAFRSRRPYDLLGGVIDAMPPEVAAQAIAVERRLASHVSTHMLDPQTLAYAMHDSPAGQLAWLLHRRRAWGDTGGDVESRFARDDLLTHATIYWATESFGSAIRIYAETGRHPWAPAHDRQPAIEAPAGLSIFRGDGAGLFGDALVDAYDVRHLAIHESGGHFAAAEEPAAVVEDIRATFRRLR